MSKRALSCRSEVCLLGTLEDLRSHASFRIRTTSLPVCLPACLHDDSGGGGGGGDDRALLARLILAIQLLFSLGQKLEVSITSLSSSVGSELLAVYPMKENYFVSG